MFHFYVLVAGCLIVANSWSMRSGGFYPADKNCQTEQQLDKLQICQSEPKPPALLHFALY